MNGKFGRLKLELAWTRLEKHVGHLLFPKCLCNARAFNGIMFAHKLIFVSH